MCWRKAKPHLVLFLLLMFIPFGKALGTEPIDPWGGEPAEKQPTTEELIDLLGWDPPATQVLPEDYPVLVTVKEYLWKKYKPESHEIETLRAAPDVQIPKEDHYLSYIGKVWNHSFVRHKGSYAALLAVVVGDKVLPPGGAPTDPKALFVMVLVDKRQGRVVGEADLTDRTNGLFASTPSPRDIQFLDIPDFGLVVLTNNQYGGDLSTAAMTSLFRWDGLSLKRFFGQVNLNEPVLKQSSDRMPAVTGIEGYTLCTVCDGWDAGEDEMTFRIPVQWTWSGHHMQRRITLDQRERGVMLKRVDDQLDLLLKEPHISEPSKRTLPQLAKEIRDRLKD